MQQTQARAIRIPGGGSKHKRNRRREYGSQQGYGQAAIGQITGRIASSENKRSPDREKSSVRNKKDDITFSVDKGERTVRARAPQTQKKKTPPTTTTKKTTPKKT